jgi:hypothetical protein
VPSYSVADRARHGQKRRLVGQKITKKIRNIFMTLTVFLQKPLKVELVAAKCMRRIKVKSDSCLIRTLPQRFNFFSDWVLTGAEQVT